MSSPPRPFSTAARAQPNFPPHMRPQRGPPRRWLPSLVAISVVVLATKNFYLDPAMRRRAAALDAQEREDVERRRQHEAFMDSYGDRSSLAALEEAVGHYEKK